jgi:hypothetical protein
MEYRVLLSNRTISYQDAAEVVPKILFDLEKLENAVIELQKRVKELEREVNHD